MSAADVAEVEHGGGIFTVTATGEQFGRCWCGAEFSSQDEMRAHISGDLWEPENKEGDDA